MTIDHLGVVVPSIEEGIAHWSRLFGYRQYSEIVENTRQKVRVVFMGKPGSLTVKLVAPSSPDSSVSMFARRGGGLHHLCFRCEHLSDGIAHLEELGAKVLVPPQPGEAFEGNLISFLFAGQGLNIELIDTSAKQGWTGSEI